MLAQECPTNDNTSPCCNALISTDPRNGGTQNAERQSITHINDQKVSSLNEAIKLVGLSREKVVLAGVYEEFSGECLYTFVK